jgi:plastocyanin
MGKLVARLAIGLALALVVCGGVFAAPSARPAAAPVTWQAGVGGATPDGAVQAMAFLPTQLTIDEGDTVTWTFAPVHTVSFLSGGNAPELVIMTPEGPMLNLAVALPSGGPAYDGTGYVNSGVLPADPTATSFSLTFSKAGTYNYICLLHPGMAGQVVVQAAGAAYPETQASVTARGQAELYSKLSASNDLIQNAKVTSKPANGATNYAVNNGIGGNQSTVLRYLPTELTINAGDSVTWTQNDPHEIHTVTFYDPAGKTPGFLDVQPQANGPPKFFIRNTAPGGGNTVDKVGFYNSGVMTPGQSFTLTFSKPGTYTYVCVIHAEAGQVGTIVVKQAGGAAPGQPAQLPNTGGGAALPLGWLALAAGLAGLLGLLLRRAARAA